MLSIHFLSLHINITWNKKEKSNDKIQRSMHVNKIEQKINEARTKCYEYIRFL